MGDILESQVYGNQPATKVRLTPEQTLGQRIFFAVVALTGVMLVSVVGWAWLTYPSVADVAELTGTDAQDRLQLWREAKAEWVQQLISVAQMAIFGSLVPLLGTVAGYLLGERASREAATGDLDV